MMLSSIMGHGSWWILHSKENQLDASGSSRPIKNQMAHLKRTMKGSWKNNFHRNKILIMRRLSPHRKMGYHSYFIFLGNKKRMESSSNGCEDYFLK
jgi:hypothetical protein